jgi:SLT domain-containing protein
VLAMLHHPELQGLILAQMQTESGGNARAINLWDSNAKAGTPSMGLMQVIQPTFDAYAGPFRSLGIWNPLANIYAAVAYALSRYGRSIAAVLGHGHGYATGGIISEPVTGIGHRTGHAYFLGERGPEMVSPLSGPGSRMTGLGSGAGTVIHVYPSAGMDERALAAMVSRELAWATAGGTR